MADRRTVVDDHDHICARDRGVLLAVAVEALLEGRSVVTTETGF
jgi:hypothetical protein